MTGVVKSTAGRLAGTDTGIRESNSYTHVLLARQQHTQRKRNTDKAAAQTHKQLTMPSLPLSMALSARNLRVCCHTSTAASYMEMNSGAASMATVSKRTPCLFVVRVGRGKMGWLGCVD